MRKLTEEEIKTVNGDIRDQIRGCRDEGVKCRVIEATVWELADLGVGTIYGTDGNRAFKLLAERFPTMLVRCGLEVGKNCVRCCDIRVTCEVQGKLVEELVEKAEGSLRFDSINPATGWAYFEN